MNKTNFVKLWNAVKSQYKKIYLKYGDRYIYADSYRIENIHTISFFQSNMLCTVVDFNDILRVKGIKNIPEKYREYLTECDYYE
ncbi:MAG: hypothetical protein QXH07_01315 [Thermoplasmata archaeon]